MTIATRKLRCPQDFPYMTGYMVHHKSHDSGPRVSGLGFADPRAYKISVPAQIMYLMYFIMLQTPGS